MTKASAKKIKDPLAKTRGKCDYDYKTALTLSYAYWASTIAEYDYDRFAKICEHSGLSDNEIMLGDPKRKANIIDEIHERFVGRMLLFAHEDNIRWIWGRLLETNYFENPSFLYFVLQNDLDISETFFPYVLNLRAALTGKSLQDFATPLCPSNNAVNHSLASLAPWDYAPDVSQCSVVYGVRKLWKDDPFRHFIATDPFFNSTVELGIATLRKLEERGVSEYFVPDAAYLPAFLTTGLNLSDKYFYRPSRLGGDREHVIFELYKDAATRDFPCGMVQSRFREKPDLELAIANQSIRFYEGQALYYEFPFALSEYGLEEAIRDRIKLLEPGATFTFMVRQDCPSNRHWLEVFGRDEFSDLLFSGTSADMRGNFTTTDDVVRRAIRTVFGVHRCETIESHDDAGNLVATQYIITRE